MEFEGRERMRYNMNTVDIKTERNNVDAVLLLVSRHSYLLIRKSAAIAAQINDPYLVNSHTECHISHLCLSDDRK